MRPELLLYRTGNFFFRHGVPLLPALLSYLNRLLFSCWIPSSASIGNFVKIGYWGLGVVIHNDAIIGNNCLIGQNVTIGRNKKDEGVPRIGNNVYIAAGAVVVGNIRIGNNVIIGANSLVRKDVPSGVIVGGCPAAKIGLVNNHDLKEILGNIVPDC